MSNSAPTFWEQEAAPDAPLRSPWQDDTSPADALLRPVWEDLPDETAPPSLPRRSHKAPAGLPIGDAAALLIPLAAAQDCLARLDARAETAPAPIRTGLIARLALREAAGWLASRHAWVHPHDLALRAENLAGRFDTAAQIARTHQALPNTLAARRDVWDDPEDLVTAAAGEQAVVRALALARLLTALPRRHNPLATSDTAAAWLAPLVRGELDAHRFSGWRAAYAQSGGNCRCPALPPLLRAATAAGSWMEAGVLDEPGALDALALAALLLARMQTLRVVPLPFWAAWPALGQPEDMAGLPRLRPAIARDLAGVDRAPWPLSFLAFTAEAAQAGLRELDRLHDVAAASRELVAGLDRRARLPAAVDLVLASPLVTPRGLATKLNITLQAANRILAALETGSIVREVTGRGSFRAFAA